MEIDHIFIFSTNRGKVADELVEFGFKEGSSRVHKGQGTMNRKFYFENFFLEILWVIDENEIKSETTAVTKLWERSQFQKNNYSPYGLCLVNAIETDKLFEKSKIYQPNYFPKDMGISILTNHNNPQLPWTFRLPYRNGKKVSNEPIEHPNGIKSLTRVLFEVNKEAVESEFVNYFNEIDTLVFSTSKRTHLTLEFDHNTQQKEKCFAGLNFTVKY